MIRYKKNHDARLPVIFKSLAGSAVPGVTSNIIIISIRKASGVDADVTPLAPSWSELTGTAYASQGYYNYNLTGTYTDVTGVFQYCVAVTGAVPYFGVVEVVEFLEFDVMARLGVPVYGTVVDDIGNVGISAASGGFSSQDRTWLSSTFVTCSALPADPASNSHVDSQLSQSFWSTDRLNLNAIKAKTDNLPADPASNAVVVAARDTITSNASSNTTTINNNTNTRTTEMKGAGWLGTYDTLHNIGVYSYFTYNSGALSATIVSARDYLAGDNYVSGTDALHQLRLALDGITPSSGGGGFSTNDRAMLESAYSRSLNLPVDPLATAYFTASLSQSQARIMGSGSYTGTTTGGRTVKEVYDYQVAYFPTIYTYTTRIPTDPSSNTQVVAARDYLAGPTFTSPLDTLAGLSDQIQSQSFSASFTPTDRAYLTSTYSTVNDNNGKITVVKQKTDLLPNDVVSTAHIDPQLATIISASSVSGGFSTTDRDNINAIKSKTDNLPTQPADATVTFGTSDRNQLAAVYSKTDKLPVDPASTTYVQLVSQSLSVQMLSEYQNLYAQGTNISASISGSNTAVLNRLGSPAAGTVSADIANVGILANNAAIAASSADISAGSAATSANTAAARSLTIINTLGSPMSGTVSADISSTFKAVSAISATFSGTVSASVDFSPILGVLGRPVSTVSNDIRQVALLVKTSAPKK